MLKFLKFTYEIMKNLICYYSFPKEISKFWVKKGEDTDSDPDPRDPMMTDPGGSGSGTRK